MIRQSASAKANAIGECRENALVELVYREEFTPSRRLTTADGVNSLAKVNALP